MRTPEQVGLDIGEAIAESGIGVGSWGDVGARMAAATEIEARMWEDAYKELYSQLTTKAWLALTADHEIDQLIAIFTDRAAAERWKTSAEPSLTPPHLRELPLNPSRAGAWRYWIIDGEESWDFNPALTPETDPRWPSYDMVDDLVIVGACGLGWTFEEARAAAVARLSEHVADATGEP